MKTTILLLIGVLSVLNLGCDDANAPNCLKKSGDKKSVSIDVETFSQLTVSNELNVILHQSDSQKVILTTGENLMGDIDFEVVDDRLTITNNTGCNWVRDYDFPQIDIYFNNLELILMNGSGYIKSYGTLKLDKLNILSENCSGDVYLNINLSKLYLVSNSLTNFYISGKVVDLDISFASGDGRFDGTSLKSDRAKVKHRGTNDIILHVTQKLDATIWSSGNIILKGSKPSSILLDDEYLGELIDKTE